MDCLIVGFNEIKLEKNIATYEVMKKHSGAYRHLLHGVVRFQGKWMHYTDVFNTILSDAINKSVHLHLMRMPNLAVCYLQSYLTKKGFDVDSINFYNAEKERFEELLRLKPAAVALTTTYYLSEDPVTELVRHIKRISPDTIIIAGGPYISGICTSTDDYLSQDYVLDKLGADIYINSPQGELTLSRVLDELRIGRRKGLGAVPNLIFRPAQRAEPYGKNIENDGGQPPRSVQFVRTPLETENNDLNENRIDWSLFPRELDTPAAQMRSARGCPFECAFCNFPSIAGQLSYSDIGTVENEMKQLSEAGVRYLTFIDDSFNIPKSRFKEILRMMISSDFNFHWFSFFRCSHADNETYDLMQESGCRGVFLGIESGDQGMLDNMNKKVRVEQFKAGIRKLHERGIFTFASFIVGFPGETEISVQNTIAFIEDTQPTFFKADLYSHEHNAPIHKKADQYGFRGNGFGWQHNTMDWQKACDNVERIYRTVEKSLICPVYMFDFWAIPYFLAKGISLDQIKQFLKLCRPLLLRNFDSLPSLEAEEYSVPLFALGKEIACNLAKESQDPPVSNISATEHAQLSNKGRNGPLKDSKSDELLQSLFRAAVMSSRESIKPRTGEGPAPLSASQQHMWFLSQLNPGSPAYNTFRAFLVTGKLDRKVFKDCIEEIVRRHEVLRTAFPLKDDLSVQVVRSDTDFDFSFTDLTAHDAQKSSEAEIEMYHYSRGTTTLHELLSAEARKTFDLVRGPCLRVSLFRLAEHEHCFLLSMPHVVCDGWSLSVFYRELADLYEAFSQGRESPLQTLKIQCADYAVWQRERLEREEMSFHIDYWRQKLRGHPRSLNLPTDLSRPSTQNYCGACEFISLPKDLTEQIKTLSSEEGASLFMTLLAAFQILLYRYTGQEDIVVGAPVAGRNHPGTQDMIGCFVNTVALRTDLSGSPGFQEVLARVKTATLDAFAHQDLPFQKVIEHVQKDRDITLSPLFRVMFVLQNTPEAVREFSGLTLQSLPIDNKTSKLDLSLILEECPEGVQGKLEYSTDLFKSGTIKRMTGHILVLLKSIVAYPDRPVSQLPMLTEAERHQILVEWNNPVGRAQSNTRTYILDRYLNPVPPGIQGEVYVGVKGPAPDDRNHPDLSGGELVPDPFGYEPGALLHRTGDLARYLPDGTIEILGKTDPAAQGNLRAPGSEHHKLDESCAGTRTPTEELVTGILCEVLRRKQIGIHDNFFELGGHSLLAIQVISRLRKVTEKEFPLVPLFQYPTAAGLAGYLDRENGRPHPALQDFYTLYPIQTSGTRPPFFWIHSQMIDFLPKYLGQDQPLYALIAQGVDGKRTRYKTMKEIAAHYLREIRTVQPAGPYFLGGFCWGTTYAFEIARQLLGEGEAVGLLLFVEPSLSYAHSDRTSMNKSKFRLSRHRKKLAQLPMSGKIKYVLQILSTRLRLNRILSEVHLITHRPMSPSLSIQYALDIIRQASRDFVQKTYPKEIIVIQAETGHYPVDSDWSTLAEGGVKVHVAHGATHMDLLQEPGAGYWAEWLNLYLRKAQATYENIAE